MTVNQVVVPTVNANDTEAVIVRWAVSPWQHVDAGDLLCEIETTKATVEVEATGDGYCYPVAEAGTTVDVGAPLAWIFPSADPAQVVAMAEQAGSGGPNIGAGDVLVSRKAQALMDLHGLTVSDFPGKTTIGVADIEARRTGAAPIPELVDGLDIDGDSIVLFGSGRHTLVVCDALLAAGRWRIAACIDDDPLADTLAGAPVLGSGVLPHLRKKGLIRGHVAFGEFGGQAQAVRQADAAGVELVSVVHPTASVSSLATLRRNVFVGPQAVIGPDAEVGDLCQILNCASVAHHCRLASTARLSDGVRLGGTVSVGARSVIGLGATVNKRITIGRNVLVVSGVSVYDHVADDSVVRADGSVHPKPQPLP